MYIENRPAHYMQAGAPKNLPTFFLRLEEGAMLWAGRGAATVAVPHVETFVERPRGLTAVDAIRLDTEGSNLDRNDQDSEDPRHGKPVTRPKPVPERHHKPRHKQHQQGTENDDATNDFKHIHGIPPVQC